MSKTDSDNLIRRLNWLTLASLIVGFAIGWGAAVFVIYNGWFNPWK